MRYLSWLLPIALFNVAVACGAEPFENTPKMTVRGVSSLHKPADEISLTIGLISQATDAETVLKDSNEKMQSIIQALEVAGISKSEYETGRFSIQPIFSQPPKIRPENWTQTIVGYEVTNTVNVKTSQLSLAGDLIDAANHSGANLIDSIQFSLKDDRAHREEAIAAAAANAISDAQVLASSTNLKIVRILQISLDEAQIIAPVQRMLPTFFAKTRASAEAATPIVPGDVTVSATVTVIYEIRER